MTKNRGVPTKKSGRMKALEKRITDMLYNVILFGDVLAEARTQLIKSGRLKQRHPKNAILDIRLGTLNRVLHECLKPTEAEIEMTRGLRVEEEFKKKVEEMKDKICPVVIIM